MGIAGHKFRQTLQKMKSDWLYRSWVVSKVLTILGMCMQCQPIIRLHPGESTSNPDLLYAGTDDGIIQYTNDGG